MKLINIICLIFLIACNPFKKEEKSNDENNYDSTNTSNTDGQTIDNPLPVYNDRINIDNENSSSNGLIGYLGPTAFENLYYEYQFQVDSNIDSITPINLPDFLQLDINSGKVFGVPTNQGVYSDIKFEVSINGEIKTIGPFTLTVLGDPLFKHQWGLLNIGQKAFSNNGGEQGEDINIIGAREHSLTGTGVKVAVIDTGLEVNHEDLKVNVDLAGSRNYNLDYPYEGDPTNNDREDGDHGTSVAGIISAVGWNGIGVRGVAPSSKVAGLNYIASSQSLEYFLDSVSGDFDIFNQSFIVSTDNPIKAEEEYVNALKYGVSSLRNGKGAIYVKSVGNEFADRRSGNNDPYNVLYESFVVGSMNANGVSSSYSSSCSCLLVTAPGGEYGQEKPAIGTTDQSGCSKGYSKSGSTLNPFSDSHSEDQTCNYTTTFNATSAAAGFLSGAVALILEANSNLTWRDVKNILIKSARKVDSDRTDISINNAPAGHVYEQGWVTNSAGLHFHNWYGFGAVDVGSATSIAKAYQENLGQLQQTNFTHDQFKYLSGAINLSIPDFDSTGVSHQISVTDNLTVEAVQVVVDIDHTYSGDLGIELTSPNGTKQILLNIKNSFASKENLIDYKMMAMGFYGENSVGAWTIKVIDGSNQDNGVLKSWKINILGH